MNHIVDVLSLAAAATLRQLIGIFGIFFICGFLLFLLSKLTRNIYHNAGRPNLDIYVTGWIGTPVHELGHAVFCILFRHTITGMKLFTTVRGEGSLGFVTHKYNRRSLYQQTGNFFIGAGPVILGSVVIAVLAQFLLPDRSAVAAIFSDRSIGSVTAANLAGTYPLVVSFSLNVLRTVFAAANVSSAGFWLFLYLSLCIASHMGLSPSDIQGMGGGMAVIVVMLFAANLAAALMHADLAGTVMKINGVVARALGVFVAAILISLLNLAVTYAVLGFLHYRKSGSWVRIV
jgi:hypothetical protein